MIVTAQLGERLGAIEQRRAAGDSSSDLEMRYLELAEEYGSPEQQASIHAAIAVMYANDGMREPAKVVSFAKRAVKHVSLLEACQLCVYWGEALETLQPPASRDREAIRGVLRPYLEGLKLTGRQPAAPALPLPAVGKFDDDGPTPDRELEETHRRDVRRRAAIELQNDLARYRALFVQKCAALIESAPQFANELRRVADALKVEGKAVADILKQRG